MKRILFDSQAKEKLQEGVDLVANAVGVTLGPSGKFVVIGRSYGPPLTTKDGVTVAKSISSTDLSTNIGCELIKEVSKQQLETCGDGTTTATVIAQYLINNGLKVPMNIREKREKLKECTKDFVDYIERGKRKLTKNEEILHIAEMSTNNDKELGSYVYEAIKISGIDGTVLVEDSKNSETKVVSYPGYMFERGYVSHHFSGNDSECKLNDVYVLMTDDEIKDWQEIRHIAEACFAARVELLIICKDISENALRNLIVNVQQGRLKSCVVKLPALRNRGEILLEDIAVKTGGIVVSPKKKGHVFKNVKMEHLGRCDSVTVDKDKTVLIGGKGNPEQMKDREELIRADLSHANKLEKILQEERLAKYIGGVSVIHVGAYSESELEEKKARIDDAVRATKEAIKHGIVIAGSQFLAKFATKKLAEDVDEMSSVFYSSLIEPLVVISDNCLSEFELNLKDDDVVFDYANNEYVDAFEKGLIDPASVVSNAVTNAVSLAAMVLATDAVIYPEDYDVEQAVLEGIKHGQNRY